MELKKIYLELTNKCNLNCSMCYRKYWKNKLVDMNNQLFYKIYREIINMNELESIVLGGIGEPTFSPIICEAIELLKDFHLTITTNGTLLNGELLNLIIKYVDVVIISIDGLDTNFKNIRKTNLNKILENIKILNDMKMRKKNQYPIINFQYVISEDNIDDIFGVIDLGASLKVDTIIISNLLPQSEENKDKILYTKYENKKIKDLFNKASNYSFKKGIKLILPYYELKTERRCNFIDNQTTYICSSGDIVPCYRLSCTYKEYIFGREKNVIRYSFGNVKDKTIKEIWESKKYVKFRDVVRYNLYPSCIDCDLAEGCDMVNDTQIDCYGYSPTCGDCLWSRKLVMCP